MWKSTLGVSLVAASLLGCVDTKLDGQPTAELLVFESVDPVDGSGTYALRPIALEHLSSIDELRDDVFDFVDRPVLHDTDVTDPGIAALVRHTPQYHPRVMNRDGVAIPRDTESLIALSSYHALRTIYDHGADLSGLPLTELTPDQGFPVLFHVSIENNAVTNRLSANAFYAWPGSFFGIVDIDGVENIPVSSALPVLAHEFGHHLFLKGFLDPAGPDSKLGEAFPIRGLNEGYADFNAFAMTGVTNVLADSLPSFSDDRGIDPDRTHYLPFTYDTITLCHGEFYCIGTLFARSLYGAFRADGGNPEDFAQRTAYARDVFGSFAAIPGQLAPDDPLLLSTFLYDFVAAMPQARRPALCDHLTRNFGARFSSVSASVCR